MSTMISSMLLSSLLIVASFLLVACQASTTVIKIGSLPSDYFSNATGQYCTYAGEIRLGHPMSLGFADRFYGVGIQMFRAAQLTVDKVNAWPRCGVSVEGAKYSVSLTTYDDESSTEKTAAIGRRIVNTTDFMTAGYSSTLTAHLTPITEENRRLCITAGSSRTSVHAGRKYAFGLLPPNRNFLESVFIATKEKGAKTVAFLTEEDVNSCLGAPEMAEKYGMEFLHGVVIEENSPLEVFKEVAQNMSKLDPDVMITCVRINFQYWNQAMRKVNWSPKAQVYTIVAGTPEFEVSLGTDLPYVMGVSTWDRALPPIPDGATGWTPRDFDTAFEAATFRRPAYQYTSQSAAISIILQAIERVGTFDNITDRVRQKVATESFPTVFGNVTFDENGQSNAPSLLVQYDANNTLHVLRPTSLVSTDFEMVYPLPSWTFRDCVAESLCPGPGLCLPDGSCACPEPLVGVGLGSRAACIKLAETMDSRITLFTVTIAIAFVVIVLAVLYVFHQRKEQNADSLWQIRKEELLYDEPPEIIGRGSFGIVLLAEYRGTKVAVKRILRRKQMKDRDKSIGLVSGRNFNLQEMVQMDLEQWGGHDSSNDGSNDSSHLMDGKSKTKSFRKAKKDFIKEMRCVSQLRHPCITTVMGAVSCSARDPMIVMEYMDHGSLYDILHNETMYLEGEIILPMLQDISQGLRFLHSASPQVVHGDLKAQNILVDAKFRAKVADFGLSQKKRLGTTGTPYWMAPEVLNGGANTPESDIYSFGILLYEVFSRKEPYDGEDPLLVLRDVANPKINKRPPVPRGCPSQLEALMSDCQLAVPDERPSAEELDKRLRRVDVEIASPSDFGSKILDKTHVSLFDIFPKHIAEALRKGKTIEAEHRDMVTIFFSDIIGFTEMVSDLSPRKVAQMLHRLYYKFDQLSEKHQIFKVETIGDAYMAVTNLVQDQATNHTKLIAEFAVDAIAAANSTLIDDDDPSKGYVDIRVGFHSGPVVADVVGSRNPRYCLFGDSVNIASRMETYSGANRIHCSAASAILLQKQGCPYPLLSRGLIEVKGKGEMLTYWVNEGQQLATLPQHSLVFDVERSFEDEQSFEELEQPFEEDQEDVFWDTVTTFPSHDDDKSVRIPPGTSTATAIAEENCASRKLDDNSNNHTESRFRNSALKESSPKVSFFDPIEVMAKNTAPFFQAMKDGLNDETDLRNDAT